MHLAGSPPSRPGGSNPPRHYTLLWIPHSVATPRALRIPVRLIELAIAIALGFGVALLVLLTSYQNMLSRVGELKQLRQLVRDQQAEIERMRAENEQIRAYVEQLREIEAQVLELIRSPDVPQSFRKRRDEIVAMLDTANQLRAGASSPDVARGVLPAVLQGGRAVLQGAGSVISSLGRTLGGAGAGSNASGSTATVQGESSQTASTSADPAASDPRGTVTIATAAARSPAQTSRKVDTASVTLAGLAPDFRQGEFGLAGASGARREGSDLLKAAAALQSDLQATVERLDTALRRYRAAPIRWPIRGRITSPFGYRRSPFGGQREFHYGIDIAAPTGTPIYPAGEGVVVRVAYEGAAGWIILIDHGNGWQSYYSHNQRNLVKVGQRVTRKTVIATVGSSGRSTGPHVQFEVRYRGVRLDPLPILNTGMLPPPEKRKATGPADIRRVGR